MEEKVARLYVYDEKGEDIGRLVVDMERLIDMYCRAYLTSVRQGNEVPGEILREQTDAPRSEDDAFHKAVTAHVGWWKKASDGTFYLKRVPEQEVDEK